MNFLGMQSLITIVSQLFFILLSFWALKGVRIEKIIKKIILDKLVFFIYLCQ